MRPTTGFERKRSGGPRTAAGKARVAQNALVTGATVPVLMNAAEQADAELLHAQLTEQYGCSDVLVALTIERLAIATVRLRRLQRTEAEMFEKARSYAEQAQADASAWPAGSAAPPSKLTTLAVMPDLARLEPLARYMTQLQREIRAWWASSRCSAKRRR